MLRQLLFASTFFLSFGFSHAQIHMDMQLGGMLANYRNFNLLSSEIVIYPQLKESHWLRPQFMLPIVSFNNDNVLGLENYFIGLGTAIHIVKWERIQFGLGVSYHNLYSSYNKTPTVYLNSVNSFSSFYQIFIEARYLFSRRIYASARFVYVNGEFENNSDSVFYFPSSGAVGGGVAFGFRLF